MIWASCMFDGERTRLHPGAESRIVVRARRGLSNSLGTCRTGSSSKQTSVCDAIDVLNDDPGVGETITC